MPGMMETVLNLGMSRATARGVARATGDKRFAFDAYRRLLQMYGSVVADIDGARFEQAIDRLKHDRGIELDSQLTASDFIELAGWFEEIFREETGVEFPTSRRWLRRQSPKPRPSSRRGTLRERASTGASTAFRTTSEPP